MNFENKKVVVVGLAKTGLAVVRFLIKRGAQVVAADTVSQDKLGHYAAEALAMGACLDLGPHKTETFSACDLIVVSPGVPHTIEPFQAARAKGVPVIGELELAARHIHEPIVAITGTNGKTTTTSLVGEMLRASGMDVFVGGNIGKPLIDYVDKGSRADAIVAEVSSFQLDTIDSFHPKVGVLLNITEDHLDRYTDFQGYVRSKGRLFENQETTDVAVLNQADPSINDLQKTVRAKRFYFNIPAGTSITGSPLGDQTRGTAEEVYGAKMGGDEMICSFPGDRAVMLSLARFKLAGIHNAENAAAASLAALSSGASVSGIQKALDTFRGLHHRLEYVKAINGVAYYNDSKATNVGAVLRALESFDAPVILIMGGRDKGGSYAGLGASVKARVKKLIAIGEAKESILAVLGGFTDSEGAKSLDEAVRLAEKTGSAGDVVLLSPGGSSFDMFADYAQRGEAFRRAVENL
ncbi:MAG: UDP-N-acetylmuramoyl-L-alanine--D-glutamate ligase [Thermodesulfobacteriota bacterium]|nr:UDP-N-acetylmuramoyl-L-alanine--D-glutamate ligase [Thermodesulfobacteriota bacterium]